MICRQRIAFGHGIAPHGIVAATHRLEVIAVGDRHGDIPVQRIAAPRCIRYRGQLGRGLLISKAHFVAVAAPPAKKLLRPHLSKDRHGVLARLPAIRAYGPITIAKGRTTSNGVHCF